MGEEELGSLVNRFLSGENYSPATKRAYTADLSYFVQSLPSGVGILEVDSNFVTQYIKKFQASSPYRNVPSQHHPASLSTKARKTACLRRFYRWCLRNDLIKANPVKVRVQTISSSTLLTSEEDIAVVLSKCSETKDGQRDAALICVLAGLGLKVSQAVALNTRDVVIHTGVNATIGYYKHKQREQRTVVLPIVYEVPLAQYFNQALEGAQPMFTNKSGKRLSQRGVRRIIQKYAPSKITCESLRNAFFARLVHRGYTEKMIADCSDLHLSRVRAKCVALRLGMPPPK